MAYPTAAINVQKGRHPMAYVPAPISDFTADGVEGVAPFDVQFTNLSTGTQTSWLWDFGDGETSTLESPLHTYAAEGTYTVALTVTGPGGSDAEIKADWIWVSPVGDPIGDALRAAVTQYWKLDEASGTRVNAKVGGLDLSNSGVLSTTGKLYGLAALFSASDQVLSHATASGVELINSSYTIAAWVYANSAAWPGYGAIVDKSGDTANGEYAIYIDDSSPGLQGRFYAVGDALAVNLLTPDSDYTLDAWHLIIAKQNASTQKIFIRMDNRVVASADIVINATPTIDNFHVGNSGFGDRWNGRIGPVMIFKGHVTTDEEDAYLWNNNAGRALFP